MSINYTVRTRNGGIQYRVDPLTGGPSRINPARSLRPKAAAIAAPNDCASPTTSDASSTAHLPRDTEALVLASRDKDPFFPQDKLYRSVVPLSRPFLSFVRPSTGIDTSRGVMERGDACLFLNLFPFAENHAVITTSQKYYVSMPDTTPKQIADALALAAEFSAIAAREDAPACSEPGALSPGALPSVSSSSSTAPAGNESSEMALVTRYLWPSVVWNYMPSSAGSIIHPHLQCFAETVPPPLAAAAAVAAGAWADANAPLTEGTCTAATAATNNEEEERRADYGAGSGLKGFYGALVAHARALLDTPHPSLIDYASAAASASASASTSTASGSASSPAAPAAVSEALAAVARAAADPAAVPSLSRYIGNVGRVEVLAPFAPRTNKEVHVCVPVPSLAALSQNPSLLHDAAAAVAAVVHCFHRCGVGAFNMASFGAPELRVPFPAATAQKVDFSVTSSDAALHCENSASEGDAGVDSDDESVAGFHERWRASSTLTLRLFARPYPSGIYTSDSGPAERQYDLNIVETLPEVYAAEMRAMWSECAKARA